MSAVHVVPEGDRWAIEIDGTKHDRHDTQAAAIEAGRERARQEQGELVIHGADGEIREKDSHGNDPRDIPG